MRLRDILAGAWLPISVIVLLVGPIAWVHTHGGMRTIPWFTQVLIVAAPFLPVVLDFVLFNRRSKAPDFDAWNEI